MSKTRKLLSKNKAFFARIDPDLAQQISSDPPVRHRIVKKNDRHQVNVIRQQADGTWQELYRAPDPKTAARKELAGIPASRIEAVIVAGIGLGYHLEALADILPPSVVFIILEEDEDLFRIAMRHVDFSRILASRPWRLLLGEHIRNLVPVLVTLFDGGITSITCCAPAAFRRVYRITGKLQSLIKQAGSIVEFNRRTRERLCRQWTKNCLRNMVFLPDSLSLISLKNKAADLPASIICAGPSLDRHLHLIKELVQKTLTICTDAAYPVLITLGLEPHFVVSFDPFSLPPDRCGRDTTQRCIRTPGCKTYLVCPLTASTAMVNAFHRDVFFSRAQDVQVWPEVRQLCDTLPLIPVAGSVSLFAYEIARHLGARPILFVGQDFSFPGFKIYSRGTRQAERFIDDLDRYRSPERLNLENILSRNPLFVSSPSGVRLATTRTMLHYRFGLDNACSNTSNLCVNCTGDGLMPGASADLLAQLQSLEAREATFFTERISQGENGELPTVPVAGGDLHKARVLIESRLKELVQQGGGTPLPAILTPFTDLFQLFKRQSGSRRESIRTTAAFLLENLKQD